MGVEFPIAQRVFNDVYSLDFVEWWCELFDHFGRIHRNVQKNILCMCIPSIMVLLMSFPFSDFQIVINDIGDTEE